LGPNHVGFLFPKYEIDFRNYLEENRDPRHLQSILLQVGKGILELQSLGYVHRDLKPDNIVLNLKPLRVAIIDFDRVKLDSTDSEGTFCGTPGYYPDRKTLKEGSRQWDMWAFAAIILEADMKPKEYRAVNGESQAIKVA